MHPDQPSLNGLPEPGTDDEINLREIWNLLVRNWGVLGLSLVIATGAAWTFSSLTVPVYESVTTIRIDEERGSNVPVLDILQNLSSGSEVETEMEVLRSRTLAEAVVDSLGLKLRVAQPRGLATSAILSGLVIERWSPEEEYRLVRDGAEFRIETLEMGQPLGTVSPTVRGSVPGASFLMRPAAYEYEELHISVVDFGHAVERLREEMNVSRTNRDASVITLRYATTDTQRVRTVPNLLAQTFIDQRQDVQKTEARSTVAFLEEQIDTLERQLRDAEEALVAYRQGEQVVSLQAEADAQVTQLANLQAERNQIESNRVALRGLVEEVEREAAAIGPDEPSPYSRLINFPPILQNQAVGNLLNQLNTVVSERTALLNLRTMQDPDVINLTQQIRLIEGQLQSTALTYLNGLERQVQALDEVLAQFSRELERIPEQQVEVARLGRATTVLESVYTLLSNRLEEARIVTAIEDPSVRVIDPAILPPEPIRPRTLLNVLLGAVLGAMLGVAIAFTREYMDDTIHTREDMEEATGGAPILGMIPRIRAEGPGGGENGHLEDRLVAGRDPRSPISEAYRSLRTNLTFVRPEDPPRIVVFTSPLPQDGKSTSSSNLAITLAQQGHRTLLVDADLRRGVLDTVFGVPREPGLSSLLAGHARLDETLHPVPLGDSGTLDFLPSGPFPPNPAELLGSARMKSVIDELDELYDYVILDSAPLTVVTDAAILGTRVDGVVVVARASRTEKGALIYTVEQLRNVRAPLLGSVLNDVDYRRDARYSSRYGRYGYSYQHYYGPNENEKGGRKTKTAQNRLGVGKG